MKNKIFSLIFGMMVILVTMAVTSTARYELSNGKAISPPPAITAEVLTLGYSPAEVQAPAKLSYTTVADNADWVFAKAGDQVETEEPAETEEPVDVVGDPGTNLFTWQNIVSMILAVISTFFAAYWNKASTTLKEISAALEDKRVTTAEIQKIVNAWKGK